MKNFINRPVDLSKKPMISVKVFSKYSEENYDTLDSLAKSKGYFPVEPAVDEKVESRNGTGVQNTDLHSGWIATVDDGFKVQAKAQVELLNEKIQLCQQQNGEDIIVGFCQTGKFSVGYTIYVKQQ